jgi:RHS repeat-associated protein
LTAPVTTNAYDAAGNLASVTDPLNRITQYRYDARNRLTQAIDPLNQSTTFGYDLDDNQTSVTDALNQVTQSAYDARSRLVSQTDALNQVTQYLYDAVDNLLSITDALNQTTTYIYDVLNRRTVGRNPLNQTTTTAYDLVGNVFSITDALNRITKYAYNALNRPTQITNPLNQITRMVYDKAGNLTRITDPINNATSYAYDALNRLITDTNPFSQTRTYQYDALGNPIQVKDRNGRIRKFIYDALSRWMAEQWLSSTNAVIRTISLSYDAAGQVTQVSDPDSTYHFTYDALGRQISEDNSGTPGVPNVVLSNVYDSVGNHLSLSDTINAQAMGTTTFGYDALQRLTQVTQTGTGVSNKRADFAYNAVSQITNINRYASVDVSLPVVNSSHTYDAASRLTRMVHQQGANVISNQTWVYNMVARITQVTSPDGTSAYSYDNTDQVTAVDHSYQTDEAYLYDANGNRRNTGYVTTTNNRLQSGAGYTYAYDNEGNRLKRTKTTEVTDYTWDYRNRLTKVETKSGTRVTKSASYIYDVFDRRIARSMYPDGLPTIPPVAERRFVYDRDHILLSFDNNNNLTHRYLYGPVLDMVLADESNGNILWTLADNLGTVRDLVSSGGVVQNHRKYDSFGNLTSQSNAGIPTRFGYTGREWDADTGLYFYRSRYYDPLVGRFISEDLIGFAAGDTNLYRYVGNSPVNAIDPMGLFGILWPAAAIGYLILVWVYIWGVGWVLQRQQQAPPLAPPIDPPLPPRPIPTAQAPSTPSPNPGCQNNRKKTRIIKRRKNHKILKRHVKLLILNQNILSAKN